MASTLTRARRRLGFEARSRLIRLEDRRFDRANATETARDVELAGLTVVGDTRADGHRYGGEPLHVTRAWLDVLPPGWEAATLVDLGSGKGRVLIAGARAGFRHCIGVEFARELHESAIENVARAALADSGRIDLVLGDAGDFEYPSGPLVVHLNNPFNERVMARVIDRLGEAYAGQPRPICVVYQQSRNEGPNTRTRNVDLLAAVPFLSHRPVVPRDPVRRWLVWPWLVDAFFTPEQSM